MKITVENTTPHDQSSPQHAQSPQVFSRKRRSFLAVGCKTGDNRELSAFAQLTLYMQPRCCGVSVVMEIPHGLNQRSYPLSVLRACTSGRHRVADEILIAPAGPIVAHPRDIRFAARHRRAGSSLRYYSAASSIAQSHRQNYFSTGSSETKGPFFSEENSGERSVDINCFSFVLFFGSALC